VARTPTGEEILPVPATVIVEPRHPAEPADYALRNVGTRFGDVIRLTGANIPDEIAAGETMTVTLFWEGTGTPPTDYTAFAHLLDASGTQVTGHDNAPAGNRFPTSFWQAGDRVVGEFPIDLPMDLPPGEYNLWVGLYESASQGVNRLPISDAGGQEVAHNTVHLGSPLILPPMD
jgi:hypothetical protein